MSTLTPALRAVFLKDLRRFWPLLSLWVLALATRVGLPAWMPLREAAVGRGETMFAGALVFLVNVLVVGRVVAEDSPVKESAFWRTRPINGGQMLAAKALFLAAWTLVLPVLVTLVAASAYGFTAAETATVLAGQASLHLAIAGVLWTVALFTPRVWTSLLVLWLVFVIAGVIFRGPSFAILAVGGVVEDPAEWAPASLLATRGLLAVAVAACGAAGAAWCVYARRRRSAAALVLGSALAAAAGVRAAWPVNLLGGVPALSRLDARVEPEVTVELLGVSRMDSLNDGHGRSTHRLDARVDVAGLAPGEFAVPYRVEGELVGPDGVLWRQALRVSDFSEPDLAHALRELGVSDLVESGGREFASTSVALVDVPQHAWASFAGKPTGWRGRVWLRVGRVAPVWRLPTSRGARLEKGAREAAIASRTLNGDRMELVIAERGPDDAHAAFVGVEALAARPVSPQTGYVLIWPAAGRFLRATGSGGSRLTSDGLVRVGSAEVHFLQAPEGAGRLPWDEAELVRFELFETRRVIVEARAVVAVDELP